MSRRSDQAGSFELLARLPQQIVTLAKIEYENAKREVVSKAKKAGIGALAIVIALFFLFFALGCFITAAIAGLSVVWPVWLSALVVGAGLLALAAAAIVAGIALMKRGNPVPEDTLGRLEGDVHAFGEVRVNSEQTTTPASRAQTNEEGRA